MDHIVVVGGSLAGVHAVEAAREAGFTGGLTLLDAESQLPYDRPPLVHAAVSGDAAATHLRPPGWYATMDVTLLRGCRAVWLDSANRVVWTDHGPPVCYDGLVIATGSLTKPFPAGAEHVWSVRSQEDARVLRRRLAGVRDVVVVGAGFLGLELAASLSQSGRRVTVVEVAPAPLARVLGDEVGTWFLGLHERHGVEIRCNTLAVAVEQVAHRYVVLLADGGSVEADLVVAATGAVPAVNWLADSGLELSDGVVCDATLASNVAGVVAAGDVARWYNPLFDESMRVQQWTNAVEQGRHAMHTLLGRPEPFAVVPYLWSDQYDARMRFVGVTNAAGAVDIEHRSSHSLVATYGRDDVQVGALCINAAGQLARHRERIAARVSV